MASCKYCKYIDLSDEQGYHEYWCTHKSCYVSIDYDMTCYGYTGPGAGGKNDCFLTSACVNYLGKSDDCKELTALRRFRDTYMKNTEEGRKLVEEYYEIAPKIVEKIDSSDKRELYYRYISLVIDKCVCLLARNELEKTLNEYKSMVLFLKKETGI